MADPGAGEFRVKDICYKSNNFKIPQKYTIYKTYLQPAYITIQYQSYGTFGQNVHKTGSCLSPSFEYQWPRQLSARSL